MYCPNCGKENAPNAAYCADCGAPIASLAAPAGFANEVNMAARRQDLLYGLGALQAKVNEKAEAFWSLKEAQRRYLAGKEGLKSTGGKTFAAISATVGGVMLLGAVGEIIQIVQKTGSGSLLVTLFLVSFGALALIPQICYSIAGRGHRRRVSEAEKTIPELNRELMEFYRTIPNNPLAYEYTNPDTIYALSQLIYLGKADSLKEAILCLDDERYKQSVQGQLSQILAAEKQTRNAMIAGDILLAAIAF